jgi:hypothetical protein
MLVCPTYRRSSNIPSLILCASFLVYTYVTLTNTIISDWDSAASRSLTPPWVPHLVSTRAAGVHFEDAVVYTGETYDVVDDPLPGFTFRVATSSVSAASKHRQQIFRTLDGCAPLISWIDGSSYEQIAARISARQEGGLKSFSRWARKALHRPIRSS